MEEGLLLADCDDDDDKYHVKISNAYCRPPNEITFIFLRNTALKEYS